MIAFIRNKMRLIAMIAFIHKKLRLNPKLIAIIRSVLRLFARSFAFIRNEFCVLLLKLNYYAMILLLFVVSVSFLYFRVLITSLAMVSFERNCESITDHSLTHVK